MRTKSKVDAPLHGEQRLGKSVVMVEREWKPANEKQEEGRLFRNRFYVKLHGCGAYQITDLHAKEYNMPEMAVTIYFGNLQTANELCALLNKEWARFVNNPT